MMSYVQEKKCFEDDGDDGVSFWSNFRENDPHNIFRERQILVCECQQNAVEFSDGFRKKKKKQNKTFRFRA